MGKTSDGEIDFVAVRQNEKIYVQVTQEISSEKAEKREYDRLLEIHDNYPKYVLMADEFAGGNYEGIKYTIQAKNKQRAKVRETLIKSSPP